MSNLDVPARKSEETGFVEQIDIGLEGIKGVDGESAFRLGEPIDTVSGVALRLICFGPLILGVLGVPVSDIPVCFISNVNCGWQVFIRKLCCDW